MKDTVMVLQRIQQIVNACHIDNHTYRSDEHEEEIWALTEAMQAVSHDRWIPVGEDLPEYYSTVLVTYTTPCSYEGSDIGTACIDECGHWWIQEKAYHAVVTAWKPLPEPYKKETDV